MMLQTSLLHRAVPALACAALLALSGCSGTDLSRSFGLVRDSPDEFTVTTRAPLSMPPDFSLRAPEPGAPRPQERAAPNAAEAALVPQAALAGAGGGPTSPGQQALLQQAGPAAPGNIRARVDQDAALAGSERSFADRVMFWRSPPPPGVVVDPARESQRLRENAALGQTEDTGVTPIIQRKPKSFFDSIL